MHKSGIFKLNVLFIFVLVILMPVSVYGQGSGIGSGGGSSGGGSNSDAGANFSGGGGCSDCFAPTLGLDKNGVIRLVDDGLTINGNSFNVELYFQDIPTQVLYTDETVEIILKILEDRGPGNIEFVTLSFINYDVVGGVVSDDIKSSITWTRDSGILVNDKIQMLQNVHADLTPNTDDTASAVFSFQITKEIDLLPAMKIQVSDAQKNVWNNYFENAISVKRDSSSPLISTTSPLEINSEDNIPALPFDQSNIDSTLTEQDVLSLFGMLVQIDSERKDALNAQAGNYIKQTEFRKALEIYTQLNEEYQDDPDVLNNVGYTYLQSGQDQKALEYFEKALVINPNDIQIQNNKIIAIFNLGNYTTALLESDKTLEQAPQDEITLGMKALILAAIGNYDEAQTVTNQVLKINPNNVDALTVLAISNLENKNLVLSHYYLTVVTELDPTFYYALLLQSKVSHGIENYADSNKSYDDAISLPKVNAANNITDKFISVKYFSDSMDPIREMRLLVAENYYSLQDYDFALDLTEDILNDDPRNVGALELRKQIIAATTEHDGINDVQEITEIMKLILYPMSLLSSFIIIYRVWRKINPKRIFQIKNFDGVSTNTVKRSTKFYMRDGVKFPELLDIIRAVGDVSVLIITAILWGYFRV